MFEQRTRAARLVAAFAGLAIIVGACSSGSSAAPSGGAKTYKIGYSNGQSVGNGFREEQVCTAKAQATTSGKVSELVVKHRNTDAAGQASDIRDLIAAGVNAIIFNPNDPDALNSALQEAKAAGIKTISIDAYVTDPDSWNLYNNQVKYAELGAEWLFKQLGGKGTVWYTRGLAGHPADLDRDIGFKNVLKKYPDIKSCQTRRRVHGLGPGQDNPLTNDFRQRPVRPDPGDLGVGHGQADRRRDQGGQQAVRADRRCRHRWVRLAAP
jgi:ribose transport system substrate-binding protein